MKETASSAIPVVCGGLAFSRKGIQVQVLGQAQQFKEIVPASNSAQRIPHV
jgi:hypothetical protein